MLFRSVVVNGPELSQHAVHRTGAACLAINEYPWCLAHPACIISIRRGAWHTAAEVAVAAQQRLLTARLRDTAPDHPVVHRSADGHRGCAGQAERRFALVADGHDWLSLPLNVEVAALFLLAGRDRT